jgi:hypothetical protein
MVHGLGMMGAYLMGIPLNGSLSITPYKPSLDGERGGEVAVVGCGSSGVSTSSLEPKK